MDTVTRSSLPRTRSTFPVVFGLLLLVYSGLCLAVDTVGFLQGHLAARLGSVDCPQETRCDLPYQDVRLRLKSELVNKPSANPIVVIDLDLIADRAIEEDELSVRELYLDYSAEKYSLRVGRQIITWGVGDLIFINDTFPKSWESFFGGQPPADLKLSSSAIKLSAFPALADFELIVGGFRADELPGSERFILAGGPADDATQGLDEPTELEVSLRVSRYFNSWQMAFYGSRTHARTPAQRSDGGVFYPRLNTVGASLSGSLWQGVVHFEAGFMDAPDDPVGDQPGIDNSESRVLAGYSGQVAQDTTIGVQAYAEWMHDYDDYRDQLSDGFPQRDQVRSLATLRFTQLYWNQTLRLDLFAFWGVSDSDGYFIPSIRYNFSDTLWAEVGANLFTGSRSGELGALGDNDNIYTTMRYAF